MGLLKLLWGKWCNGFWPLTLADSISYTGLMLHSVMVVIIVSSSSRLVNLYRSFYHTMYNAS